MATDDHERAVELLKQLGMKTYEAECFVALHSIPSGTARDVSDVADVPRTRVYDATASLADQGFVEVQHASPQRFRAIPLEEAVRMLREQYELRVEALHETLLALESSPDARQPASGEVWALSAGGALDGRVVEYVEDATEEVVLFLGDVRCWSGETADVLEAAGQRGVTVHLCAPAAVAEDLAGTGASVEVVGTDAGGLAPEGTDPGSIGRVLLVDRERMLVSAVERADGEPREHAVLAEGETNGAVLLSRRLLGVALDAVPAPE